MDVPCKSQDCILTMQELEQIMEVASKIGKKKKYTEGKKKKHFQKGFRVQNGDFQV